MKSTCPEMFGIKRRKVCLMGEDVRSDVDSVMQGGLRGRYGGEERADAAGV